MVFPVVVMRLMVLVFELLFHLTLFTSTDYTLDIFSDTKAFFGSFVALGDSMMNYFQNVRLQGVRNEDSIERNTDHGDHVGCCYTLLANHQL
jgi:hypothetical protein